MLLQTIKKLERYSFVIFVLAYGFLCFVGGSLATYFELPPYHFINDAVIGHKALQQRDKRLQSANRSQHIKKQGKLDLIHEPGAYDGLTLFNTFSTSDAYLVDMDGKTVHHWGVKFSEIWPDHPQVSHPVHDKQVCFFGAKLYPNGDLLATFEGRKDTPWGYGLAKIDRDSHLIWRYSANINHTLDIGPDGKIYALNQKIIHEDVGFLPSPMLTDFLVVLSPEGKLIDTIPLLEALMNSPYNSILKKRYGKLSPTKKKMPRRDFLHANSTSFLTPEMAEAFPMFKAGQVLISFRHIGTIAVLDIPSRQIVWAAQGPWKGQHEAKFQPDGTITMLDNLGKGARQSRILKYDPGSKKVTTLFEGNKEHPFYTSARGMQQVLPNNNVLITEASHGRVFEVTPEQEIVWQLIDPYRIKNKPIIVTTGLRYSEEQLPFLKDKHAKLHPDKQAQKARNKQDKTRKDKQAKNHP